MRGKDRAKSNVKIHQAFNETFKQPDKPEKTPSDYRVTVRLSPKEHGHLKIAASDMTISAYIRSCLFGRRTTKRVVPDADRVLLAQILARLGQTRMANNLNQIAYHANCGSLVMNEATEEEIKEACANIAWMRVKLIEALGLKDRD